MSNYTLILTDCLSTNMLTDIYTNTVLPEYYNENGTFIQSYCICLLGLSPSDSGPLFNNTAPVQN